MLQVCTFLVSSSLYLFKRMVRFFFVVFLVCFGWGGVTSMPWFWLKESFFFLFDEKKINWISWIVVLSIFCYWFLVTIEDVDTKDWFLEFVCTLYVFAWLGGLIWWICSISRFYSLCNFQRVFFLLAGIMGWVYTSFSVKLFRWIWIMYCKFSAYSIF